MIIWKKLRFYFMDNRKQAVIARAAKTGDDAHVDVTRSEDGHSVRVVAHELGELGGVVGGRVEG